jgi:AMME syndrome candidate gene 1 protein
MATIEHCLFCFESLAAHLENRKALTLDQIQKSWADYKKAAEIQEAGGEKLLKHAPAIRRVAASSASDSSNSLGSSSSSSSASSTTSLPQPPINGNTTTPASSVSSFAAAASSAPTESPLFVTWNTVTVSAGAEGEESTSLRGCIGTFEAQPLEDGLSEYALIAALHDYRFRPITKRELPTLEVAVTLLTDFEDAKDAMDWEIGTHGIRLSFYERNKKYGSTYLPDVAVEQGWNKEQTLVSLMRKAGWQGRKDKWRDVHLKVTRYQGRKVDMQYLEYKKWRDWVDQKGADPS